MVALRPCTGQSEFYLKVLILERYSSYLKKIENTYRHSEKEFQGNSIQ